MGILGRKPLSKLKVLHQVSYNTLLKPLGFKLEIRNLGEKKLGLLRKTLSPPQRNEYPRRLIFIPGLGDTPLGWFTPLSTMIPSLKNHYHELIFIDFPGFAGFLQDEKPITDFTELRDFLFETLDTLRPEVVLGHSMGGWLAAQYLGDCGRELRPRHRPKHAYHGPSKAVLINPAGLLVDIEEMTRWQNLFLEGIQTGFEAYRPHLFAREPFWFRFLAPEFGRFIAKPEVQQFIHSITLDHMVNEAISQSRGNVVLLWGDKDSLSPSHWMDAWVDLLKNKALGFRIWEAGHSPHIEKPWATFTLLQKILSHQESKIGPNRAWEIVQKK